MAQMKTTIKVRKDLDEIQRRAVAQEVIDHIVKRSKAGKDRFGKSFPGYSKSYTESKDFEIAGKSKSRVNLTLSGELLDSLKLLEQRKGQITIGYDAGDTELNAKAEGNIKGTYGNPTPLRGKKRDYLGIQRSELVDIQNQYDPRRTDATRVAERIARIRELLDDDA